MGITFAAAMQQAIEGLCLAVERKLHRPLTPAELATLHRSGEFLAVQELSLRLRDPAITTEQTEAALKQLLGG